MKSREEAANCDMKKIMKKGIHKRSKNNELKVSR